MASVLCLVLGERCLVQAVSGANLCLDSRSPVFEILTRGQDVVAGSQAP